MEKELSHAPSGRKISERVLPLLVSLGRGLGTVSVYGTEHPIVEQIIEQTFAGLQGALRERKSVSIGTFNGTLTVDEEPVSVQDVPVRMLEKRLSTMKISHLTLTRGLTRDELKKLLSALCEPTGTQMKETLSGRGMDHVKMSDVKYVALRDGEQTAGGGGAGEAGSESYPAFKVNQIVAFIKGQSSGDATGGELKKMLSDPERLGQLIMEASSIRQSAISAQDGESLADIVVGCLRRTYDGLRKEDEFRSPQGKVNLTKGMMLLEKTVLDKIHAALGARHPDIDRRIFEAIREMDEEHQFEALTAQYFDQRRKVNRIEEKIIERIQKQGGDKTRLQFSTSEIPPKDWQRLMVKAGAESAGGGSGAGENGLDLSALAVVLEKLEGLMQISNGSPDQIKTAAGATRSGLQAYTNRIETRIQDLENQIELRNRSPITIEDHSEHLNREDLMIEVSQLTLALFQPLTVVNAALETCLLHTETDFQKELLDLALSSGRRVQSLTKRLINLVGYPVLKKT